MVRAVFESRDGGMWVGTPAHGLTRLLNGTVTRWTTRDGLPVDGVSMIGQSRDGAMWIGTPGGLIRMEGKSRTSYTTASGLPHNNVRSFFEDHDGRLWIGTVERPLSHRRSALPRGRRTQLLRARLSPGAGRCGLDRWKWRSLPLSGRPRDALGHGRRAFEPLRHVAVCGGRWHPVALDRRRGPEPVQGRPDYAIRVGAGSLRRHDPWCAVGPTGRRVDDIEPGAVPGRACGPRCDGRRARSARALRDIHRGRRAPLP